MPNESKSILHTQKHNEIQTLKLAKAHTFERCSFARVHKAEFSDGWPLTPTRHGVRTKLHGIIEFIKFHIATCMSDYRRDLC
jgi:hypothetical protein